MRKMIAYCGLDCEKCDAYIATINDDQHLREKTAKAWSELNQVPILPEHINCQGCRTEGIKTVFCDSLCEIRQCALKRSVTTCCDCLDMKKCKLVGMIISNNPDALNNLEKGNLI
ncbi:MAG: DUF3795 domain-containing protein [Oliverpabstia sp.]